MGEGEQVARRGRDFVLRHGETVFNAAARMQGEAAHTPLTRRGFAQAEAVGLALRARLGPAPALALWSSPAGRALQTLAVIAEVLELDWHAARTDPRLAEIGTGSWGGRRYAELEAAHGPVVLPGGLIAPAPDGEPYLALAARVSGWLADTAGDGGDRLVVTHGIAGRVLRGLATGAAPDPGVGVPVAPALPQGTAALLAGGRELAIPAAPAPDGGGAPA